MDVIVEVANAGLVAVMKTYMPGERKRLRRKVLLYVTLKDQVMLMISSKQKSWVLKLSPDVEDANAGNVQVVENNIV